MSKSIGTPATLCIIVPCYNEEDVLPLFYAELTAILSSIQSIQYKILFIDDGSTDQTLSILSDLSRHGDVRVLSLSRNYGHQIALTAGLDSAGECDAAIMMDADTQHPPELILDLVDRWQCGADIVSTVRQSTDDATLWKRISSRAFYWLLNRLSETPIEPGAADFCLLSARALQAVRSMPERHRFLRGMVAWIGFQREFVAFEAPPRPAGESKYTSLRMLRLALDATFSFSSAPLRFATRIGMSVLLLGFAYLGYVILRHFTVGDLVPGWASLLSSVLILGGAQLVCMGLIGEYIARIFEESKGRPLYFLKHDSAESAISSRADTTQAIVEDDYATSH